ncbi:MAG TPA: hypothetical protein VMC41_00665 [Candidatus Nanoarchaeia archaeon]|nr:hypothetical protein [Candidatus Nanoarchaeia archaeon]
MHTNSLPLVALFIAIFYSFSLAQINYPKNSRLDPFIFPENSISPSLLGGQPTNGNSSNGNLRRNNRDTDQNQWQSEKRKIREEIKAERKKTPYV